METAMSRSLGTRLTIVAVAMIVLTLATSDAGRMTSASVIVQGTDMASAAQAVRQIGGEVTRELGIINAVGAELTAEQRRALIEDAFRVIADRGVSVAGAKKVKVGRDPEWDAAEKRAAKIAKEWEEAAEQAAKAAERELAKAEQAANQPAKRQAARDARGWEKTLKEWNKEWAKDAFLRGTKPTFFTDLIGATALHDEGITGHGVSIAIVDTGLGRDVGLRQTSRGERRVLASYDAQNDTVLSGWEIRKGNDGNGHGTHVAAVALSSRKTKGALNGVAPDANLVVVKAFDEHGEGTYGDVIRSLDWVLQNHARLNIRMLNLSFSASPQSHYWDDPINQAVMRLWQEGIVVVASAGNTGPDPMTIGVPGNLPYVVTVGAMTDSYTPDDRSDDRLTWFTAAGPTHEGFVKPDLVAPGGHIRGVMPRCALASSSWCPRATTASTVKRARKGTPASRLRATPLPRLRSARWTRF